MPFVQQFEVQKSHISEVFEGETVSWRGGEAFFVALSALLLFHSSFKDGRFLHRTAQ